MRTAILDESALSSALGNLNAENLNFSDSIAGEYRKKRAGRIVGGAFAVCLVAGVATVFTLTAHNHDLRISRRHVESYMLMLEDDYELSYERFYAKD